MAETFGPQKVRLEQALELIGDHEPVSYGEIVELIATASACKERAAKDNLRSSEKPGFWSRRPHRIPTATNGCATTV